VAKVHQLPRRSRPGKVSCDCLCVVVGMVNDGSPVRLVQEFPSPPVSDIYAYGSMIDRLAHFYATGFKDV
jgi:hypothetical protein